MSVTINKLEEIEKLDEMRRMGILSEKDFELQKKVLLNQATQTQSSETYVIPTYSFLEANWRFWTKALDWKSRATRAEYWWVCLAVMLMAFVVIALFGESEIVQIIFGVVLFIPATTLVIRRIHDTGHSAKFLLWPIIASVISLVLFFIPPLMFIGMIIAGIISFGVDIAVLVFSLLPSQPHKNIYDAEVF